MTSLANHPKSDPKLIETSFAEMQAAQKLNSLAKTPYDLSLEGNLSSERIDQFKANACGYTLLYATERVDKNCMDALYDLAIESNAFEQMTQMQSGDIVNFIEGYPSELRAVLHTATRDFFEQPNQAPEAVNATKVALQEINKLKAFINKIDAENKWNHILVVGIGGSELGPKAHYEALQAFLKPNRSASFLSNIDPDALEMIVRNCDLSKTLVLIISKTGTTLETLTNEEILRARFEAAGLKGNEHFISVTCPKSPLDDPQKYKRVFFMWDWVGGRYSTTSMVGGVLLAFAFGFESFWELLRGANAMDKIALEKSLDKNLPLLAALLGIWNRNFLNLQHIAIIPYSQALARFPAHIQQLDMESNGKHIDKMGRFVTFDTGPIIFGEPGTSAQHSFCQLIHQGTTPIPLEFITFKESQLSNDHTVNGTTSQQKLLSNVFAQTIALAIGQKNDNPNKSFQGNRPSFLLIGERLTPFALGALLSFYENKVAFQGFIWHTNSFDQEGVQLGKVLATKILDRFAGKGSEYPLGDAYIQISKI